jgi:hypothetical protein
MVCAALLTSCSAWRKIQQSGYAAALAFLNRRSESRRVSRVLARDLQLVVQLQEVEIVGGHIADQEW